MPLRLLLTLVLSIAAVAATSSSAKACGGFFCNNSQPVNQAAERIIFAQNADGTTTAAIQIQYSGPSERFAWMLPVVGNPEISVSSNIAFTRLQQQTNPQYNLNVRVEGVCQPDGFGGADGGPGGWPQDGGPAVDAGSTVTVVNAGSVGPYDFVIISVDPDAPDIATIATEWLAENEYDVSDFGRDRLVPYLESGMNLLAFRLTKGRNTGEIRPVVLNFGAGLPSIPLRPTAAAATPDMGILVFVVGPSRAVPANYLDLELNEARINWLFPSSNYDAVVTQAANEAGGQGFVTEFADAAGPFQQALLSAGELSAWNAIAAIPGDYEKLTQTASLFAGWDGLLEVFLAELTKPASADEEFWAADPLSTLREHSPEVTSGGPIEGFDFTSFAARIEAEVITPVRDTAALFAGGQTLTRMYTTMSSEEMTMDPVFHFNEDLPGYSNIHSATQVIECMSNVTRVEAPWRVELEDGTVVRGRGNDWRLGSSSELPAMKRSRRVGTSGQGAVITDNAALIASVVSDNNSDYPPGSMPGADGGPAGSDAGGRGDSGAGAGSMSSGGGCGIDQQGSRQGGGGVLALLMLGLAWMRRR